MIRTKLLTVFAMSVLPFGQAIAQGNDSILDFIDGRYEDTAKLARTIWEYAEVGYQETRSSTLLQETLSGEGFAIEAGVASIPTAFVATHGNGGPVIAILAEFDALPGISQDRTPVRQPRVEVESGHACGHHLFGAGSTAAAIAVREWLEASGTPGTVRLYGTPADTTSSVPGLLARQSQSSTGWKKRERQAPFA